MIVIMRVVRAVFVATSVVNAKKRNSELGEVEPSNVVVNNVHMTVMKSKH